MYEFLFWFGLIIIVLSVTFSFMLLFDYSLEKKNWLIAITGFITFISVLFFIVDDINNINQKNQYYNQYYDYYTFSRFLVKNEKIDFYSIPTEYRKIYVSLKKDLNGSK